MKKALSIFMVLTVALFAFACGGAPANTTNTTNANKGTNAAPVNTATPVAAPTTTNANTPATPANGSKPMPNASPASLNPNPQAKSVEEKMKEKEAIIKSANAAPAPPAKKP